MKNIFFLLPLLFSLTSWAWREGNGGDGVKINNNIYLLDLVEAGIEITSETNSDFDDAFFNHEVKYISSRGSEELPVQMIVSKLGQVYERNKVLALVLLSTMKKLNWRWVEFELTDLADEGKLKIPKESMVQLALRINQTVQIQKNYWHQMDDRNKTALLFHEIIYSLMEPWRDNKGLDLNSPKVRTLTAFLFSPEYANESLDLILRTEAPHLSFPTTMVVKVEPSWDSKKESILINKQWFATGKDPITDATSLSLIDYKSTKLEQWGHDQCLKLNPFSLGLIADEISVQFQSIGSGETEEFYLVTNLKWQSRIASAFNTHMSNIEACQDENQAIMTMIAQATIKPLNY